VPESNFSISKTSFRVTTVEPTVVTGASQLNSELGAIDKVTEEEKNRTIATKAINVKIALFLSNLIMSKG
jgi:hypothetical protein